MLYITAIRVTSNQPREHHIASVRWLNSTSGLSNTSNVSSMVEWLAKGNRAFVAGEKATAEVHVVRPVDGTPYLRSQMNGQWTDNLLNLPRF